MALAAFCTVCQRTVYVDEDSTAVCPVCSSPLLETTDLDTEPTSDEPDKESDNDQPDGAK